MNIKKETIKHIKKVKSRCKLFTKCFNNQFKKHDKVKLYSPEKEYFEKYTPILKKLTYGSKEYKENIKAMKPAIDHHYEKCRHHPEHFKEGIVNMDLIDLTEMLMDWWTASERHENGDIFESIELNQKRFNYSDDLKRIMINTITRLKKMNK